MCSYLLCCWKRMFDVTSVLSWQNSFSFFPASFCTPSPKLPVTSGISWLPTFAFQSFIVKMTSFLGVSLGTIDCFQIGKAVRPGYILSPCLFNLYAEYIMWNAGLDEAQAGIKIAGRNINNLRYTDDTTLMAESKEELKGLLMKVKEESEKAGLKLSIQKTKIMASSPIPLWQIDREKMEAVMEFIFLGSKITADSDCSHEIKRHFLLRWKLWPT